MSYTFVEHQKQFKNNINITDMHIYHWLYYQTFSGTNDGANTHLAIDPTYQDKSKKGHDCHLKNI